MNTVSEVFDEIASNNSRNHKIAVLEQVRDGKDKQLNHAVKTVLLGALDPTIDYYVREFEEPESYDGIIDIVSAINDLRNTLATRHITGNMARKWVTMQMGLLSEKDADLFKRVVKRDLRCGVKESTVNKVWDNLIYVHPYMRCAGFNEKNLSNISYPCYSQTKMDGQYIDIFLEKDGVTYRSRSGTILPLNDETRDKLLMENVEKGTVLQGEALALNEMGTLMERALSNGYVNSSEVDPQRVVFYLWDMVGQKTFYSGKASKEDYRDRYENVSTVVSTIDKSWLNLVDTKTCNDKDDIVEHFKSVRIKGEEGTVIKDLKGKWKSGTSKHQVKIKVVFDCDLKVTGWKEGKGKHAGKLGALTCETEDGEISVSVGGGYKDNERESFLNKVEDWISSGQIVCIRANDVTVVDDKLSLFLPRFVEIRKDKNEADSRQKVMDQVKSFTNALEMVGGK